MYTEQEGKRPSRYFRHSHVALRGEKSKLRFVFIAPVYIKIITAGKCREPFLQPLPDGLNQKNAKSTVNNLDPTMASAGTDPS